MILGTEECTHALVEPARQLGEEGPLAEVSEEIEEVGTPAAVPMFLTNARRLLRLEEALEHVHRHGSLSLEDFGRIFVRTSSTSSRAIEKSYEKALERLRDNVRPLGLEIFIEGYEVKGFDVNPVPNAVLDAIRAARARGLNRLPRTHEPITTIAEHRETLELALDPIDAEERVAIAAVASARGARETYFGPSMHTRAAKLVERVEDEARRELLREELGPFEKSFGDAIDDEDETATMFTCEECDFEATSKSGLAVHKRKHARALSGDEAEELEVVTGERDGFSLVLADGPPDEPDEWEDDEDELESLDPNEARDEIKKALDEERARRTTTMTETTTLDASAPGTVPGEEQPKAMLRSDECDFVCETPRGLATHKRRHATMKPSKAAKPEKATEAKPKAPRVADPFTTLREALAALPEGARRHALLLLLELEAS